MRTRTPKDLLTTQLVTNRIAEDLGLPPRLVGYTLNYDRHVASNIGFDLPEDARQRIEGHVAKLLDRRVEELWPDRYGSADALADRLVELVQGALDKVMDRVLEGFVKGTDPLPIMRECMHGLRAHLCNTIVGRLMTEHAIKADRARYSTNCAGASTPAESLGRSSRLTPAPGSVRSDR